MSDASALIEYENYTGADKAMHQSRVATASTTWTIAATNKKTYSIKFDSNFAKKHLYTSTKKLICGNCNKVLEEVCKVPTHGFAIDEQMNLSFVRDMAYKYGKGFGGNLKLTTSLMLGMISPREDALISLATGGTQGYTFAPG